jgi:hypothetical protein
MHAQVVVLGGVLILQENISAKLSFISGIKWGKFGPRGTDKCRD